MANQPGDRIAPCYCMKLENRFRNCFFRRSRIVWIGKYLGFFDVPALIIDCLQLILFKCETKRKKTSVSTTIRLSASSWKLLSALMPMFEWQHVTASSSSHPPPTMAILSTGAPTRRLSYKTNKLDLPCFHRKPRSWICVDLGSGTEPSSIILRMGGWPRERFFLATHLIDVSLYLSNVTSVRWKSFPEARTAAKFQKFIA